MPRRRVREPDGKPLVDVRLRGKCSKKRCPKVDGKALVDTGAAHSFIDTAAVKKLGLKKTGRGKIRGVAGGKRPLTLDRYGVKMAFPGLGLRDVPLFEFGAYAKPLLGRETGRVALIGRNAMSGGDDPRAAMNVRFDGRRQKVELRPAVAAAMAEQMSVQAMRKRGK